MKMKMKPRVGAPERTATTLVTHQAQKFYSFWTNTRNVAFKIHVSRDVFKITHFSGTVPGSVVMIGKKCGIFDVRVDLGSAGTIVNPGNNHRHVQTSRRFSTPPSHVEPVLFLQHTQTCIPQLFDCPFIKKKPFPYLLKFKLSYFVYTPTDGFPCKTHLLSLSEIAGTHFSSLPRSPYHYTIVTAFLGNAFNKKKIPIWYNASGDVKKSQPRHIQPPQTD